LQRGFDIDRSALDTVGKFLHRRDANFRDTNAVPDGTMPVTHSWRKR